MVIVLTSFGRILAALAMLFSCCSIRAANDGLDAQPDVIFADGFEKLIQLTPFLVPVTSNCSAAIVLTANQDTPVRACYRMLNLTTQRTFTHQHVVDNVLGVTYDHDLTLAPGANIIVESDLAPFLIAATSYHFVNWTASSVTTTATDSQIQFFGYDPNIQLRTLLVSTAANCLLGIVPSNSFLSGITADTVAPGTPLFGCYRAKNEGSLLNTQRLVDDVSGTLLNVTSTNLGQGEIYSVPRSLVTTSTTTFGGTWHAGFNGDDMTRSTAHSTVTVVANPACSGTATSSTFDYVLVIPGYPPGTTPSGMRLDFTVAATPLHNGQTTTITANGRMTSLPTLLGEALFGPRADTIITLPVPIGIDMTKAIGVVAFLDGTIPLSSTINSGARTIVLKTGPISGAPATIDLSITAKPDGAANPVLFRAPSLELDMFYADMILPLGAAPDPAGPNVLTAPLCTP